MELTEILIKTDLQLYSLIILIFLSLTLHFSANRENIAYRLFSHVAHSLFLIVLLEVAAWILREEINKYYTLHWIIMGLNQALCYLPTATWLIYMDYKIFLDWNGVKKRCLLYFLPFPVIWGILVFALVNPGTWLFLDPREYYLAGTATVLIPICIYLGVTGSLIFFIRHRQRISNPIIQVILLCTTFPFIGSLIQMRIPSVSLNWSSYTLTILFAFIILEISSLSRDDLTKLPTRAQFEKRLKQKILLDNPFTLLIIDLNDFKMINDRFGHPEGDEVLRKTAHLLLSCTNPEDAVCRYGGDEFLILIESERAEMGEELVKRIETGLAEINAHNSGYSISVSYGWKYVDNPEESDPRTLLNHIDIRMYEDKKRRKKLYAPAPV